MEYVNNSNPHALVRRGGVPASKTNKDGEYYAKKMATRWSKRNLELASCLELEQAQGALLGYGITTDGPYSAASSLLGRINLILSRPIA